MGKMKSLAMAMVEEMEDMYKQLEEYESELAFLEHEMYSLAQRIAHKKEQIADQEWMIRQHKHDMEKSIYDR